MQRQGTDQRKIQLPVVKMQISGTVQQESLIGLPNLKLVPYNELFGIPKKLTQIVFNKVIIVHLSAPTHFP